MPLAAHEPVEAMAAAPIEAACAVIPGRRWRCRAALCPRILMGKNLKVETRLTGLQIMAACPAACRTKLASCYIHAWALLANVAM